MEIYLVRHTPPDVEKGICYGYSDVALTANFKAEAERILENFPSGLVKIYTSPLLRCRHLADFLSQSINLPVVSDDRLKELNFGDWEMKRWDDVDQTFLMKWMNNYETERCPNGESYTDLVIRVKSFIIESIKDNDKPVVIVTHAGVAKAFHALLNGVSLHTAMNFKIGYGEIVSMNSKN